MMFARSHPATIPHPGGSCHSAQSDYRIGVCLTPFFH
jgi:hypothetical protein